MGRLPENVLNELRSPARALRDLIDKYEGMPSDQPTRFALGRMIRQLAGEITRSSVDTDRSTLPDRDPQIR